MPYPEGLQKRDDNVSIVYTGGAVDCLHRIGNMNSSINDMKEMRGFPVCGSLADGYCCMLAVLW